jgi:hypothetical protein
MLGITITTQSHTSLISGTTCRAVCASHCCVQHAKESVEKLMLRSGKVFSKPARKQTTQHYIVLHAQQDRAMHLLGTGTK